MTTAAITADELENLLRGLDAGSDPPSRWIGALPGGLDLDDDDLCEVASEIDPRGPLASIVGLLEGLRLRHAGCRATVAVLTAIEHYHLPRLVEALRD